MNTPLNPDNTRFPILDEDLLLALPKSSRPVEMDRIYTSPTNEDWVTWNVLRALQRTQRDDWWAGVLAAARVDAMSSERWASLLQTPRVHLWHTVKSPPAYEQSSRSRMHLSDKEKWRQRADNPRPVEGRTRVDLVFEGDRYLIFVDAKLHTDISDRTTYDPNRNQIARTIDCLIEEARDREPVYWMFVRDRLPTRMYEAVIDLYKTNPAALHDHLPHRDPRVLDRIIESIAVVTWNDLVASIGDDAHDQEVLAEVRRRVSPDEGFHAANRATELERLQIILPRANWRDVDSTLSSTELVNHAVDTLDLDTLRRKKVKELVRGVTILGDGKLSPDIVPTGIRWRLLPLLPESWAEIADVTIGEMLSWDSIGVGKIRKFLAYAAALVLENTKMPLTGHLDEHRDEIADQAILNALRQFATWGIAAGHTNLVDAIVDAAEGRSDAPLNALAVLDAVDLSTFARMDSVH